MQFFRSALLAATCLFVTSSVALPTTAQAIESLSTAVEVLEAGNSILKRGAVLSSTKVDTKNKESLCRLDNVVVPVGDGALKLTDAGFMRLKLVVIGHGTQNYTCADSTANSKPAPIGAYAEMFDASCFATFAPAILHWLPDIFLHRTEAVPRDLLPKVGLHYFHPDITTAVFDINEPTDRKQSGLFVGKKLENVPAPQNANRGIEPDAFGAVDWLKLVPKNNVKTECGETLKSVGFKAVYRVHTAGGKAPATCEGRESSFTIPYATEYWLYN
ncbi:hypothetical protein BDZ91DRAFT_718163 [Kalaharituber pfeilii]|nr:hypothetical protein BDZ91DRAFT_718163 [Kalaharituber pfeilii]